MKLIRGWSCTCANGAGELVERLAAEIARALRAAEGDAALRAGLAAHGIARVADGRRRFRWWWLLLLPGVAALALTCVAVAVGVARGDLWLLPGSGPYRAISPAEARVMESARRDVFPNDVREDLARHAGSRVVWAGVARRLSVQRVGADTVLYLELEHRYFDWIEDHGAQREWYFLSPRGEGRFAAAWALPPGSERYARESLHEGDLFIVYGTQMEVRDGVIGFGRTAYLRPIARREWRDDVMDYGRPGTPTRHLRVAF
ncbi:MAG: hypothetical protein R3A52_01500 [Polyangiales bacterium]